MSNVKANITRTESIAVDVITAKGAALKHAGFWSAMLPLVTRAYVSGNDKEQWSGKGSNARPLRTCWAAAFTAVNGKLPSTAGARAFRALSAFVSEEQTKKGRDISLEGVDLFLDTAETIVAGILAPARKAKTEADKAKTEADKADKAIKEIQKLMDDHLLNDDHIKALADIVTRAKASTAKASTAKASTAKASTAKAAVPA